MATRAAGVPAQRSRGVRVRVTGGIRSLQRVPALLAALGIFPLLAIVLKRAVDVPYWDEWEWAELVYAAHRHTLTFARLWQPHNEHRILIPNLLALGLDAAGGWTPVREELVSLALLAATQLGLWVLFRRTVPAAWRGIVFLAATVVLLGLVQFENLGWGFQMAWFLCDAAVVAVAVALSRPHASERDLLLAAVAATIASLSSSQGLLAWPVGLVLIALIPRRRVARGAVWLVLAVAVSAVVRAGSPHGEGAGHAGLGHPFLLARYVLAYLGAPLGMSFGPGLSILAGGALLVWLAALAAAALRGPLGVRVRTAPWLALAAYPVLAAAVTSVARAGFGLGQATSSRYTSITALAWIAALAATCVVARRGLRGARAPALGAMAVAAAAALLVLGSVKQTLAANRAWQLHAADLRAGRAAIAAGEPRGLAPITPDPAGVTDLLGEMARIRDGVFRPSGGP
jgi:hypothetical protein